MAPFHDYKNIPLAPPNWIAYSLMLVFGAWMIGGLAYMIIWLLFL